MKFWWVSHDKTFKHEFECGYLWAPKSTSKKRILYWDNLTFIEPGDIVFSFAKSHIQGIGVATQKAQTSPKPQDFGAAGANWDDVGWHVPVDFAPLNNPVKIKDHYDYIKNDLPQRDGPIGQNGNALQRYLTEVPLSLAEKLMALLSVDFDNTLALAGGSLVSLDAEANKVELDLQQRTDIGLVEITQLIKARRGQGLFRSNVNQIEKRCRITKLEIKKHLIASHIRPWSKSDDFQKLDGFNGLMLSPHIDHLFDRGFISFENNGQLITSKQLQPRVVFAWNIDPDINVGKFRTQQFEYLEYHRDEILKNAS